LTFNLFGVAIDGLDVPLFLAGARVLFVIAVFALAMASRGRNPRQTALAVLAAGIAGHSLAWVATMFPLPNMYGVNGSMDRENHLGWANMVAQGFSPLQTFQLDHLHFEPVWPLITAIFAGFDIERVPLVFQWSPLVLGLLVLFSVRFVWARTASPGSENPVEASFAGLGALLLLSVPGDYAGPFRDPWALTFLLKPNHALGLVLAPLAALALARAHDLRSRLLAGFVLQLVGWAFVIHMALMVAGFAVFVLLSWLSGETERKKDLIDAGTAVGANIALVSPYLLMLLVAYPIFEPSGRPPVSPFSDRPIEATFRMGVLLVLSAWAAWGTYRRGSRLDRILAAQWLGAHVVWQAFPALSLVGLAREQDEAFYWCRFWTGLFAAIGVFRAVGWVLGRLRFGAFAPRAARPSAAGAISLVLLLPSLVPAWWNPSRMDQYFAASQRVMPDWIAEPTKFIKENTEKDAVFAGDQDYARWIAAHGGRRVLLAESLNAPKDGPQRETAVLALLRNNPEELVEEATRKYRVGYVVVTSLQSAGNPPEGLESLRHNPRLGVVFDKTFEDRRVMILKVTGP
jgi:hypothetical protein